MVAFKIKSLSGETISYEYGQDAELVKDDVGKYHVDISITASGKWYYRFFSTGIGHAAGETSFQVRKSAFS